MNFTKQILTAEQTIQKIKRMAYQIFENNFEEQKIVLAGIDGEGYFLAQLLAQEIKQISSLEIVLGKIKVDKIVSQQPEIQLDIDKNVYQNSVVIIVDDVLNTGKTLIFSLQPFLSVPLKKIQIAVMIDRDHDCYPIDATYIGYSLSTTLDEHVRVILSDEANTGVYFK